MLPLKTWKVLYTGEMGKISVGINQDIIPRYSSLIAVDGAVYVQVSLEKLFSALGYSKSPDEWKSHVKKSFRVKLTVY